MAALSVSADEFKMAMGSFAAGVTIVTTLDSDGAPQALTATAFSSVSVSPPLCLVCIGRSARTHRPLVTNGCFAISILRSGQEALSARFAAPVADRFAGVRWWPGEVTGCPIIAEALAFMECQVVEIHAAGDHDIFLGRVSSVHVAGGQPLVYWRGRYSTIPQRPEMEVGL